MNDLELWHFIRGAGLLAYGALWLSVVLGLSVKTRALDAAVHRSWIFEIHQTISVTGLLATALHIVLVTQNVHVPLGWKEVLVPLSSQWRPWAVTAGMLASYLVLLVSASSLLRRMLPYSCWRFLHYAAFPAWLAALSHGILSGTDSSRLTVTWTYALSAEIVLLFLLYRLLLSARPQPRRRRPPALPARQRRPLSVR